MIETSMQHLHQDIEIIKKDIATIKNILVEKREEKERVNKLEFMNKILSNSNLTEKDAEEIAKKVKRGIAQRHGL